MQTRWSQYSSAWKPWCGKVSQCSCSSLQTVPLTCGTRPCLSDLPPGCFEGYSLIGRSPGRLWLAWGINESLSSCLCVPAVCFAKWQGSSWSCCFFSALRFQIPSPRLFGCPTFFGESGSGRRWWAEFLEKSSFLSSGGKCPTRKSVCQDWCRISGRKLSRILWTVLNSAISQPACKSTFGRTGYFQ